jgi:2,4-dienoyl-CoA reductase (NADPH2)
VASHEPFRFKDIAGLSAKVEALGLAIPMDTDLAPLLQPVSAAGLRVPNALVIHPMEGCDAEPDGSPGPLGLRRYERYARGGAGMIWFEATAVVPEGKGNARQLVLHEGNVASFQALVQQVRSQSADEFGSEHRPVNILQLTHSGRYSKPDNRRAPVIAFRHPELDALFGLPADYPVISDDELEALEDRFVAVARLAQEAGFDGVDIKATHGYLGSELLAGHTRTGRYGGPFENRVRFLVNTVRKVKQTVPGLTVGVRLGVIDGMVYPYSWGMDKHNTGKMDLEEPTRLARMLRDEGVTLINVTAGNPYYANYFTRPSDRQTRGVTTPPEHPLEGIARLMEIGRTMQAAVPDAAIVGTGYSWLRQYFPYVAAGVLSRRWATLIGVGREAFAYPSFARDLLFKGALERGRVCITCSKCSQLLRDGGQVGCVVRDARLYVPIYREYCDPK